MTPKDSRTPFALSPKIVIVTGPMSSGKSTVCRAVAEEFGYTLFELDGVHPVLAERLGVGLDDLNDPRFSYHYKVEFLNRLRRLRYDNLVADGIRFTIPHMFHAFLDAVVEVYSQYAVVQPFYLMPDEAVHRGYLDERHERMRARLGELAAEGREDSPEAAACRRHLDVTWPVHVPPVPPHTPVEASGESVLDWVRANKDAVHPAVAALRPEEAELVAAVGNTASSNPFYQTVEREGRIVIEGATETYKSWENMRQLGVDFAGRTVAEIGCHQGYFMFKIEELGGECFGYDIEAGVIEAARVIAASRGSKATFEVRDILGGMPRRYDVILAMNVMHRVEDFTQAARVIFKHCDEVLFEIGKSQLEDLMRVAVAMGFALSKVAPSHRTTGFMHERTLLSLKRKP